MNAQYDGAIAYMDACIQSIFTALEAHGIFDETIVAVNGDHGEELDEHGYWYDHHGLYDNVLHVPLDAALPAQAAHRADALPATTSTKTWSRQFSILPRSTPASTSTDAPLLPMIEGKVASHESEIYITECAWMRKHGWRTRAVEADTRARTGFSLHAAG